MTAHELYDTSPEFREAIAIWVRDGRCPYDLGDWLEDRGMLTQADAARWAAAEDQLIYVDFCRPHLHETKQHPRPRTSVAYDDKFCWTAAPKRGGEFAYMFPADATHNRIVIYGDTEELAIVALLDAWTRKPGMISSDNANSEGASHGSS